MQRAVIPVERNVSIVNETTNVTNITYNNTMIVNEGPNYDQLRERSRRPVELAAVISVADRFAALREEARIKRLVRAAKLRLIATAQAQMPKAS